MTKKWVLCMVACVMAGLSACSEGDVLPDAKCTNLSKKCEQNSVYVCANELWEIETKCEGATLCNATSFTCKAPPVCGNNEKRCHGKDIQHCSDGSWLIFKACPSGEICNPTKFTCELETCSPNDSKRCSDNAVEICTEGLWKIETQCVGATVCNAANFTCSLEACSPNGSKRCDDNAVEVCAEGVWKVETQCEGTSVCNATSFVCDAATACSNNSKRCNENAIEICAEGVWKVETQCEGSTLCNAELLTCEATTCDQDATRCTSNGRLETCHDNSWSASDCDAGQTCPIGKTACEIGACDEEETRCNDTKDGLMTCLDGKWIETACPTSTPLCNLNQCVACTNGKKRCEDNAIQLCIGNVWTIEKACKTQVCDTNSYSCITLGCVQGWKRCNANTIEVCNTVGKYEPITPSACLAGNLCLANNSDHTATCIECKNDLHCASSADGAVCHSNNTCVACHAGVDLKCHPTDGTLLLCNTNGAWPMTGTACSAGFTCETGKNECTPILGYCTGNGDCTDPLYPECNDNKCTCENSQKTCKIEAKQAKHAICVAHVWSAFNDCSSATPACNFGQTQCVECSDDIHCADDYQCDTASNTCKSSLVESTITACNDISLNVTSQIAIGRVLDSRNPKDAKTITAKLLCGKNGQAISQYQESIGKHNPACPGCGEDFEFRVRPLLNSGDTYLCLWSFRLAGEKAIACQTDDTVIQDFSTIPTAETAHVFKPEWDHIIDFENFKVISSYTNTETVVDGMISATKMGAITESGDGSLDERTLVFADKYDQQITVSNAEPGAYISYLSFEYKSWLKEKFNDGQKIEVYLDEDTTPFYTLPLSSNYLGVYRCMFEVGRTVKSFRIERKKIGTATTPRLLIDNITWTTH